MGTICTYLERLIDVERALHTLLHPRLLMASLGLLSLYAGLVSTFVYSSAYLHYPVIWGAIGTAAGIVTMWAVWRPERLVVAIAGATLVTAFASRAVGIMESMIRAEDVNRNVTASFSIGAAQWMTMAYVTYVVFRRIVVPWDAMRREVKAHGV